MKSVASVLVALAVLLAVGPARADTTLYVGDTDDYAIAFKAEEAQLYVLELAADTECFFTEPREAVGPGGFSSFAAPTLMSSGPEGLTAGIPGGLGQLRAEQSGDAITGSFYLHQIVEEGFHCDTGPDRTFQAVRYLPFGSG